MILELGGRCVQVSERPGAGPAVVLLAGCAVPSTLWAPVLPLLADRAVLALDRPGMRGTVWPGRLPTLAEEVATLADLVARGDGPVVLVAHSMAGPHAEAYVRAHPGGVRGLVLVDASVEWHLHGSDLRDRVRRAFWLRTARLVRRGLRLPFTRRTARLVGRAAVAGQSGLRLGDPALRQPPYDVEELATPDAAASVVAEQGAYPDQLRDLDAVRAATPWPGLPTVVLTAAGDGGASWVADQRRLADLLGADHVVVEDARHLMMIDCPGRVAEAVRAVSEEAG